MILSANRCLDRSPNIYIAESISEISAILNPRLGDVAIVSNEDIFAAWRLGNSESVPDDLSVLGSNACGAVWLRSGGAEEGISVYLSGATGDGQSDDSPAIQRALDAAKRLGIGTVYANGGTFKLNSRLRVWSGVRFVGYGATLVRNHFLVGSLATGTYTGQRFMIELFYGASIEGFTIDGNHGATTVSVWGVNAFNDVLDNNGVVNQTQYGDVAVFCGAFDYGPDGNTALVGDDAAGLSGSIKTSILMNTFLDSCGSSVKTGEGGARSVLVEGNKFGEYFDHAVYFSGWTNLSAVDTPALDSIVSNNVFAAPLATRGNACFKVRNYASRVVFSGNTMDLPEDTAISIDVGDATYGTGRCTMVSITGNAIKARRFFSSECSNFADAVQCTISGNDVEVVDYLFHGAFNATGGPSGTLNVVGNTFRTQDAANDALIILRGNTGAANINPTSWVFRNNVFDGLFTGYVFGWVSLRFNGNTVINRLASASMGTPAFFNPIATSALKVSTDVVWRFANNNFLGYGSILFDSDVTGNTRVLAAARLVFENNIVFGNPTRNNLLDYRNAAAYAGPNKVILKNNITATADFLSTSTDIPSTYLLVRDNTTVTGTDLGSREIVLNNVAGTARAVFVQTAGVNRWLAGGGATAESGADAGTEYRIAYYNDAGAGQGDILTITRQRQFTVNAATISLFNSLGVGTIVAGTSTAPGTSVQIRSAAGNARIVAFQSGTGNRWDLRVNNAAESGLNVGSDLEISRYTDAAAIIDTPIKIKRDTGNIDLEGSLIVKRVTKSNRPASPVDGMIVYQIDNTPGLRVYENGAWVRYTATPDP